MLRDCRRDPRFPLVPAKALSFHPPPRRAAEWGRGTARRAVEAAPRLQHTLFAVRPLHHAAHGPPPRQRRGGCVVMNEIVPAHNIGAYVPMIDGPEKVTGRAKYTADLVVPGMLAGRIFRSPYSHAEIVELDISEAAKLPGVKAIITGADCDKTFGVL